MYMCMYIYIYTHIYIYLYMQVTHCNRSLQVFSDYKMDPPIDLAPKVVQVSTIVLLLLTALLDDPQAREGGQGDTPIAVVGGEHTSSGQWLELVR